jgi:pilus assembly protein TadC
VARLRSVMHDLSSFCEVHLCISSLNTRLKDAAYETISPSLLVPLSFTIIIVIIFVIIIIIIIGSGL